MAWLEGNRRHSFLCLGNGSPTLRHVPAHLNPLKHTALAGTVTLAVLGNAFICAVISGPHDRYGARMAWVATFVVLIAAARQFFGEDARQRSASP